MEEKITKLNEENNTLRKENEYHSLQEGQKLKTKTNETNNLRNAIAVLEGSLKYANDEKQNISNQLLIKQEELKREKMMNSILSEQLKQDIKTVPKQTRNSELDEFSNTVHDPNRHEESIEYRGIDTTAQMKNKMIEDRSSVRKITGTEMCAKKYSWMALTRVESQTAGKSTN